MFTTIIVQPLFNLLTLIYNLIPGHNFGLAIILFTIVIRLLLWPLVKRQLHQTKVIRALQPELKRIKAAAKGDRQKESLMMLELYKERGISPLGPIGITLLQLPILFGLYQGLLKILHDPHQIVQFSYPAIQHFPWMQELAKNIDRFDTTLFGLVDLTRPALGNKGLYIPALILVVGSAIVQYLSSRQLLPDTTDGKSLRQIFKDAGEGKQADQADVSAAMSSKMILLLPVFVLFFTVHLASALSLYWLTTGLVAFIQQSIVLRKDSGEMESVAKRTTTTLEAAKGDVVIEGEVIEPKPASDKPAAKKVKARKRRKK